MEILERYKMYFLGSNAQSAAVDTLWYWRNDIRYFFNEVMFTGDLWARLNVQLGLFMLGIWNAMCLISVATTGIRKTMVKSRYQAVRQGPSILHVLE